MRGYAFAVQGDCDEQEAGTTAKFSPTKGIDKTAVDLFGWYCRSGGLAMSGKGSSG